MVSLTETTIITNHFLQKNCRPESPNQNHKRCTFDEITK